MTVYGGLGLLMIGYSLGVHRIQRKLDQMTADYHELQRQLWRRGALETETGA